MLNRPGSGVAGLKQNPMFGSGWCGGMGVAGWLLMALLWGGFLAIVIWAVTRLFARDRHDNGSGDSAADVLAQADRVRRWSRQRLAACWPDLDTPTADIAAGLRPPAARTTTATATPAVDDRACGYAKIAMADPSGMAAGDQ